MTTQDGFGPFSDPSGGTVTNDTFTFSSSSFSDEDSSSFTVLEILEIFKLGRIILILVLMVMGVDR
jgi:hypothetical protein